METEEGSLLQASDFCPRDTKSTVSTALKRMTELKRRQTEIPQLNNSSRSGAEPSPALLVSPGRRGRRSSTQEKKDMPTDKPANEELAGRPQEKRPGEGEGNTCSGLTSCLTPF